MKILFDDISENSLQDNLWKLGARKLIHRLKNSLNEHGPTEKVIVKRLAKEIKKAFQDKLRANLFFDRAEAALSFKTKFEEGDNSLFSPSYLSLLQVNTDELLELPLRDERKKPFRICVAVSDLLESIEHSATPSSVSYAEFLKWEVAQFLDQLAMRFNIHFVNAGEMAGSDVSGARHYALRMKFHRAATVHEFLDCETITALIARSSIVLTDSYDVANLALGQGGYVIFIDTFGMATAFPSISDRQRLDIYGPFEFSALQAKRKVAASSFAKNSKEARVYNKKTVEGSFGELSTRLCGLGETKTVFC